MLHAFFWYVVRNQKAWETMRQHQKASESIRNHQLSTLGKVFKEASPEVVRYRLGIWEGPIEAERWVLSLGFRPVITWSKSGKDWTDSSFLTGKMWQNNSNHLKLRASNASDGLVLTGQELWWADVCAAVGWQWWGETLLVGKCRGSVAITQVLGSNLSTPKWCGLPIKITNRVFVS